MGLVFFRDGWCVILRVFYCARVLFDVLEGLGRADARYVALARVRGRGCDGLIRCTIQCSLCSCFSCRCDGTSRVHCLVRTFRPTIPTVCLETKGSEDTLLTIRRAVDSFTASAMWQCVEAFIAATVVGVERRLGLFVLG